MYPEKYLRQNLVSFQRRISRELQLLISFDNYFFTSMSKLPTAEEFDVCDGLQEISRSLQAAYTATSRTISSCSALSARLKATREGQTSTRYFLTNSEGDMYEASVAEAAEAEGLSVEEFVAREQKALEEHERNVSEDTLSDMLAGSTCGNFFDENGKLKDGISGFALTVKDDD